jgi:signal transduction histidine kinase
MKSDIKILMLEDIPDEAYLIEREIKKGNINFVLKRVDSREKFEEALVSFLPDVILSDHALPEFNSIEALIASRKFNSDLPFILVTGAVSEEFAVTCLKLGADDYVLKSNLSRLPSAITHALNKREFEHKSRMADLELKKQNEHLVTTNRQLLKINTELDNFVYSVSHNLRAPLSSVLGLINVARIEDNARENYFSNFFDMMQKSVERLDETLREIIDYSRNGRSEVQFETINVRDIINFTWENLKYLPNTSEVELMLLIDGPETVTSDGYRLGLIFNNLLSNAIKYSDDSKSERNVSITVSTKKDLSIEVKDNGIGIKRELLPRIFEMFFRASEKSEGAGLGLYIVKEAVEKLGGVLTAESVEFEGTVITIKIPMSQQN